MRFRTAGLVLFLVVFVAFGLSVNGGYGTDHPTSFVQLDYSIWHDHSFALANVTTQQSHSVDDFVHGGMNYSALAPGTAFLALPFLGLGFSIAGGYTIFGPVLLLSEVFVALTGALSAYLAYLIARLYFRRSTSVLLGFALAFSTIVWPYATYFFQSDVSALFVLLTAYFALRAAREDGGNLGYAALGGLAAGGAFAVDYVNGVVVPIVLLFLFFGTKGPWRPRAETAAAFLLGTLPGFATIGFYNYSIFGTPFVTSEQGYRHASSVLASFSYPLVSGLGLDLTSLARGVFIFSPFLALGVMGFVEWFWSRGRPKELLLFLSIFFGILIPYAMWYDPFGGLSYGPRFLVAAIPFLLLPAGYVVEQVRGKRMLFVYALFLAGVVVNGMGAVVSAIPPGDVSNVSPFASFALPRFLAGNLDTFWGASVGSPTVVAAALIAFFGALVPLAWFEAARKRESKGELGAGPSDSATK